MSSTNGNKPEEKSPFLQEEYWMVTGTWKQLFEVPGQDGIVGSNKQIVERVFVTEVTNKHPAVHCSEMVQVRNQYAVMETLPIPKKVYDWIMGPAKTQVDEIASRVEKELEASKDKDSAPS